MSFNLRPGTSLFGNITFTPGTNENYVVPPTHGSVNVALTATSTASTHISDRPPSLAHDGIIGISDTDGSTISNLNAWVTTGEGVGAWMQLDWSTPQTVNKIKLYDRPNVTHDHVKGGTLTFSDGSSVTVGELPDGVVSGAPDPLEVTFDAKTITWVRFTVDAFTGHNAGLTEFEVWSVLAAPPIHDGTTTTSGILVVGTYGDDDGGANSGSIYVYDATDLTAQPTKLLPSDIAANDFFGNDVACIGNMIVVGSPNDDDDGSNSGSVYVYDATDLTAEPTKLTAFDAVTGDKFGWSVDVSDNKIVVGARLDADPNYSGSVYVFDANDLSAQSTRLKAFDAGYGDQFGQAIAVSSNKIVVGAYKDDTFAGSAYVFDINDLSAQPTKLMPPDTADDQMFANAVAISEDKIVIGAYGDDGVNPSSLTANSGAAYVYDANDLTAQPTKLTPSDIALGDGFGQSVGISGDKIVIGAYADDNPTNSGSVYVYAANDLTAEPTKLTAPDAAAYDTFGESVSISGDKIFVGASQNDDPNNSGSVYVYDATDLTVEPTKLTAFDAADGDRFGYAVASSFTTTTTSSAPAPAPEPEPAPNGFQLWRLYASDGPDYYLWDIENATGIDLGDGTRLSTSGTSGTAMSGTYGQIPSPGEYGIYTSNASDPFTQPTYTGSWDAGPGDMFNGQRTSWSADTGHWIVWYLHDPIEHTAMEGGSLNLRTYVGGRPNRCPREILLQYYYGDLNSNYDVSNWMTFATLRSNQSNGDPTWTNITEGSIKTV